MGLSDIFQDIADAIRSKTGKSESIYPVDMASEIEGIESGGSDEIIRISTVDNTLYNPIQDSDLCTYSITFSKS